MKEREQVSIVKNVENVEESLRLCLARIGGMESVVKKGDKVLIKPNCLAACAENTGATTSPELVGLVAKMCFESGADSVTVAESSNWGVDTMTAFRVCGYEEAAKEYGFELKDLKQGTFREVEIDGAVLKKVRIPSVILDADVFINMPVLKTHDMTTITIGIKNSSVGISADDDKQTCLHHIGTFQPLPAELASRGSFLDYSMVDINSAYLCNLTIVDALVGQQGLGAPLSGKPVNARMILAGKSRAAVDAAGCKLIGYEPEDIPHLVFAHERGMGPIDIKEIDTFGFDLEENCLHFEPSFVPEIEEIDDKLTVVYGKGCKACLATINYAIMRHREQLKELEIPVTVFIGRVPHYKPDNSKRLYLHYGNCAGQSLYGGCFVPGCPPRSRRQFLQAIGGMEFYDPDENFVLTR